MFYYFCHFTEFMNLIYYLVFFFRYVITILSQILVALITFHLFISEFHVLMKWIMDFGFVLYIEEDVFLILFWKQRTMRKDIRWSFKIIIVAKASDNLNWRKPTLMSLDTGLSCVSLFFRIIHWTFKLNALYTTHNIQYICLYISYW